MDARQLVEKMINSPKKLTREQMALLLRASLCAHIGAGVKTFDQYGLDLKTMDLPAMRSVLETVRGAQQAGYEARVDEGKLQELLDSKRNK